MVDLHEGHIGLNETEPFPRTNFGRNVLTLECPFQVRKSDPYQGTISLAPERKMISIIYAYIYDWRFAGLPFFLPFMPTQKAFL